MSYLMIKELNKHYGDLLVLNNLSLTIEKGTFTTLLGPSGCGKSTLLRQIAGIENTQSGHVYIDGQEVTHLAPQKRSVGMAFQNYALFPNLTVYENVVFGLRYRKMKQDEMKQKASEMLELVGLTEKANQYPSKLSGGQKQRVALARALVLEPSVLLLDEPLSALDAKVREKLRAQIKKIQRTLNLTVVFVTHDQEEALSISDRIIVMNQGNIEQDATPQVLYDQPVSKYVAEFIGHYNVIDASKYEDWFKETAPSVKLAIKPESIYFTEEGIEVEIRESFLLGNIIRYECLAGEQRVTIDCLNDHEVYTRNETRYIAICKDQIIQLKGEENEKIIN